MWQKNVRYLDYNASSGVSGPVRKALTEILSSDLHFANPTSRHRLGQKVRHSLFEAEEKILSSLFPEETEAFKAKHDLIFTSSGTEANQTVLRSLAREVDCLIIGAGEHSASYDLMKGLESTPVLELPLLATGEYDLSSLKERLHSLHLEGVRKVGLSLFWANNETGVLTDLNTLREIIEGSLPEVRLHLDGSQIWGKFAISKENHWADYVTFSSHKIGAPAGTGIILKKKTAELLPLIRGTQSHGFRGGTENTLGILATAVAAEHLNPERFTAHTKVLIERLEKGLRLLDDSVRIWGSERSRVPNTSRFSFSGFKSYENWVELLDLKGFAVSHGSACKAQVIEPSRVLLKMGATREEALNSLRVSVGEENNLADVDGFLSALKEILQSKQNLKPKHRENLK